MALHPARDALVVARRKIHAVPRRRLRHAFPARGVPDRRVRHARDLPALEPRMLRLNPPDLGKLPVRRPLDALVRRPRAAVELQDPVEDPVIVDRPPRTGKRLSVPEVIAPADRPPLVRRERLNDMRPPPVPVVLRHVPEVLKKLPLIHVPRPVQPRLAQLRRQRFQLLQILTNRSITASLVRPGSYKIKIRHNVRLRLTEVYNLFTAKRIPYCFCHLPGIPCQTFVYDCNFFPTHLCSPSPALSSYCL